MTQENVCWGWLSYGLIVMAFTHTLTYVFAGIALTLYLEFITEFGLTNQDLGLLASIPSLCAALLSIPIGLTADKIGAKKMILLSIAVAIAGAVLAFLATSPFTLILGLSLLIVNTTIYHRRHTVSQPSCSSRRTDPRHLGSMGQVGHWE